MDINYLYSIVNLYLKRENEKTRTFLSVHKEEEKVEFEFYTNKNNEEKTSVIISLDEYCNNQVDIINLYRGDLMIIDEKYINNETNNISYYNVQFSNGRNISFDGFSLLEMNNIRNILCNININQEEMRITDISKVKEMVYKPQLRLQQAGFTSFVTLFLTVIFFADVLVISLWIFKLIFK